MDCPRSADDLRAVDDTHLLGEVIFSDRLADTVLVFTTDPQQCSQSCIRHVSREIIESVDPGPSMYIVHHGGRMTAFVGPDNDRSAWRYGDYAGLVPPSITYPGLRVAAAACTKLLRYHPLPGLAPFTQFDSVTFLDAITPEMKRSVLTDGYCPQCCTNYRLWHGGRNLANNSFEVVCDGCGAHPGKLTIHEPLSQPDWSLYLHLRKLAERGQSLEYFPIFTRPVEPTLES